MVLKTDTAQHNAFMSKLKDVNDAQISIRFQFTPEKIKNILSGLSLLDLFKAEISRLPNRIEEIGKQKVKILREKDEYKLPDWIGIN
jgi:hypothetical protein